MGVVFAQEILDVRTPWFASSRSARSRKEPAHARGARLLAGARSASPGTWRKDAPRGRRDVVVCDRFPGNVALKTLEGTIRSVLEACAPRFGPRSPESWAGC
jgi:hypothetical protein